VAPTARAASAKMLLAAGERGVSPMGTGLTIPIVPAAGPLTRSSMPAQMASFTYLSLLALCLAAFIRAPSSRAFILATTPKLLPPTSFLFSCDAATSSGLSSCCYSCCCCCSYYYYYHYYYYYLPRTLAA
jgi:hypothetical protein